MLEQMLKREMDNETLQENIFFSEKDKDMCHGLSFRWLLYCVPVLQLIILKVLISLMESSGFHH